MATAGTDIGNGELHGASLADSILDRGTCGGISRAPDYLCGREVPGDSDEYAADSARQVETKKLWQRFRADNCEVLRKGAYDLNNAKNTVAYGRHATHATICSQFQQRERERKAVVRRESTPRGQKEVFKARLHFIFNEAAPAPNREFEEEAPTPTNREFAILQNSDYVKYHEWWLEEDAGRKANLEKKLCQWI
jgi:hypothetical protein